MEKRGTLKLPRSGTAYYGQAVGILILSDNMMEQEKESNVPMDVSHFCRIPGDVCNATTYDFPVQFKLVTGVNGNELLRPVPTQNVIDKVVLACKELEKEGALCIASFCGFMAYLQPEMTRAVDIPVFSSSVLQIPLVSQVIAPRKVAVMTASAEILTKEHLKRCGVNDNVPYVIWGMDRYSSMPDRTLWVKETEPEKRLKVLENHLVKAALDCIEANPDVGAFVLECTNMPPASYAIQQATGMPVFDAVTLINYAHDAVTQHRYHGYM